MGLKIRMAFSLLIQMQRSFHVSSKTFLLDRVIFIAEDIVVVVAENVILCWSFKMVLIVDLDKLKAVAMSTCRSLS